MLVVVRVSSLRESEGGAQPAREEAEADDDDDAAGDQAEDGEEAFGDDVLRREERDEAEGEDAYRVRDGDGQPQEDGVLRGPARANQVSADDRLAVAGREGVQRAERGRD